MYDVKLREDNIKKYLNWTGLVVFWVVTPCGLTGGYQRFEGPYRFHLHLEETLVTTYKTTLRYNPEDQHRYLHRRENLRCQNWLSDVQCFWYVLPETLVSSDARTCIVTMNHDILWNYTGKKIIVFLSITGCNKTLVF
jgi:hypothetical protein